MSILLMVSGLALKCFSVLAAYVGGSTFPMPLSTQEEKRWLKELSEGSAEAKDVLIEHNLRLVAHIVKKFDNTGEDSDDLISIGTIGLIKAINTFDVTKKIRLATYAARCVENEILMHLRSTKRARYEVSLYDPVGVDKEGNAITLLEVLGTDPDIVAELVESQCEQERMVREVAKLSGRERTVLTLRFGLGGDERKTQREVAQELGISRSYVSRIEKKALEKVAQSLQGQDNSGLTRRKDVAGTCESAKK